MPLLIPQVGHATVRMYAHGLGDCFLIAYRFGTKEEDVLRIMIDFGVILGTKDPQPLMDEVIEDIAESTGRKLDVLVVTHEHWDHVSGFTQVKNKLTKLFGKGDGAPRIDQVWYAWTENMADPVAKKLFDVRNRAAFAVEHALAMADSGALQLDEHRKEAIENVMGFFGAKHKDSVKTRDAMKVPAELAKTVKYNKPGDTFLLKGLRFFVLGPPRDANLFKSDPSKRTPEVYNLAGSLPLAEALGVLEGESSPGRLTLEAPFDQNFELPAEGAWHSGYPQYGLPENDWREINDDWTEVVGRLALQLDSDTNNTSLVLAIQFPESGKVFLFPGDAQVGNWLSWQDVEFKYTQGGETKIVRTEELLNQTVLYKVGHHGSHNATLKDKGLEMMTSSELHAMVPVDTVMAHKKGWEEMPFEPLMTRLKERAGAARVIKADDAAKAKTPFTKGPDCAQTGRPLYVDLTLDTRV